MDTNPFDPNEHAINDDDEAWAEQARTQPGTAADPTQPGMADPTQPGPADPTQPGLADPTQPGVAAPGQPGQPEQPKWQPLPEGAWAPPPVPPPPQPGWPQQPGWTNQNPQPGWQSQQPGWQGQGQQPGWQGQQPGWQGQGQQPGWQGQGWPAPPFGYGSPAAEEPPKRSRTAWYIAAGIAVVVLIIAAGAIGAGFATSGHSASTGPSQPLQSIPQPGSSNTSGGTRLNVSEVAKKVDPATVDITSIMSTLNQEAEGTGMILTSNGEVLTNNHVIEGATSITAQVDGAGRKYTVKVLGADPRHDVALVLLEGASNLPHVTIGNSANVSVGDQVVAIGNALGLGGTPTVTSGIVSALGRQITASDSGSGNVEHLSGLIQTDAPINPGNSGGPLVNSAGQVIGMNTAADSGNGTQQASNIGFAIPINQAISIASDIEKGKAVGSIVIGTHGIMGVDVETIQNAESALGGAVTLPVSQGAAVLQVIGGSPAARAGISAGDVIVGFNGHPITTITQLGRLVSQSHPGQQVSVTWVDTNGTRHNATLTLEPAPAV
jgi:S1-C subfamily serine protease